jgi:hypothetical protein
MTCWSTCKTRLASRMSILLDVNSARVYSRSPVLFTTVPNNPRKRLALLRDKTCISQFKQYYRYRQIGEEN